MQHTTIAEEVTCLRGGTKIEMTEQEAIREAQNGNAAAFEFLYRSHSRRVYALCLRMIRNSADAEELTQEVFLCVFRKIHTFRGDSAFSTWLHRLATNIVLMRLRKKKVSETPLEESAAGDDFDEPIKEYGARDLTLAGALDRMVLDRAVAKLPAGYKQTFLLHDVQGYEHSEIAARMGYSVGNSKSQLHKARARLRKLLKRSAYGSLRPVELHAQRM